MIMRRLVLNLLASISALTCASPGEAGILVSPSIKWSSFSARPVDTEATPNYYGYGGELTLGYSVNQVFDIAGFGSYIPGRRKSPEFGVDDATLVTYGGVLGFRFASSVYLGFKAGTSAYSIQKVTDEKDIAHRHEGLAGGFSIGAISSASKQSFFQTTFDLMHHVLKSSDDSSVSRRFDAVSISVGYVFNGQSSAMVKNRVFQSFLDSITFF